MATSPGSDDTSTTTSSTSFAIPHRHHRRSVSHPSPTHRFRAMAAAETASWKAFRATHRSGSAQREFERALRMNHVAPPGGADSSGVSSPDCAIASDSGSGSGSDAEAVRGVWVLPRVVADRPAAEPRTRRLSVRNTLKSLTLDQVPTLGSLPRVADADAAEPPGAKEKREHDEDEAVRPKLQTRVSQLSVPQQKKLLDELESGRATYDGLGVDRAQVARLKERWGVSGLYLAHEGEGCE